MESGYEPRISMCTKVFSQFLTETDTTDAIVKQSPSRQINKVYTATEATAKGLIITEARRLIRQDRFNQLGFRKKEQILAREIELFREGLELGRNLCKLELDTLEEVTRIERRHKQIRSSFPKTNASYEYTKLQKLNNNGGARKSHKVLKLAKACERSEPLQKEYKKWNEKKEKCESKSSENSFEEGDRSEDEKTNDKKKSNKQEGKFDSSLDLLKQNHSNRKNVTPEQRNERETENHNPFTAKNQTKRRGANSNIPDCFHHYKKKLISYYWSQWKFYVSIRKKEKKDQKIWMEKISIFMKRLNERRNHQIFQNAEAKVAEKSHDNKRPRRRTAPARPTGNVNETAEDLKQIEKAVSKSAAETFHQLRAESVQSLHPSLKGKAKLIRLMATITPPEEPLNPSIEFPVPEILIDMDRRHEERKQRLAAIKNKKQRIEEEKDRIVREKYQQQLLEAEQEKKRKIQVFRAKLRKEQLEQEKRKLKWLRIKALNDIALKHYRRKLLIRYGLQPWHCIVQRRKTKEIEAKKHDIQRIQQRVFAAWKEALSQMEEEKLTRALALRTRYLLKSSLSQWKGLCRERKLQLQVAVDWNDYLLIRTAFQDWLDSLFNEQRQLQDKMEQAIKYYKTKLATKCLKHWMLLPQVLFLEREKESRKMEWREKVKKVLPDFRPIVRLEF